MDDNPDEPVGPQAMAIVATSSPRLPNASQIMAAASGKRSQLGGSLRSLFGGWQRASGHDGWKSGVLAFPHEDAEVLVCLLPAPMPWSSLAGPCATSWLWPEATECMQHHQCHFLVVLRGGVLEPVERRVILTRLTAAVVHDSDAIGVYWCEATLVHEPDTFLELAKSASPHDIPGMLWIDVRVEEYEDGTVRCFTTAWRRLDSWRSKCGSLTWPPTN